MATDEPAARVAEAASGQGARAKRVVHAFSAGGIVLRGQCDAREILLVGRAQQAKGGQLWALPKGTPVAGETTQHTALREVREETGLEVAITGYAGAIAYSFMERGVRYRKRVVYYTMVAIGGDTALHDHEYDFARWFPLGDALRMMRYPNEAELARRVTSMEKPCESPMKDPP